MNEVNFPDEIPLAVPPPLKTLLENDCIEITQRNKLVKLPATVSIDKVLKDYYSFICSQNGNSDDSINLSLLIEVLDGIRIYFNFTLADHLLYHEEKAQCQHLISSHVTQCTDHMTNDQSHVISNGIGDGPVQATPSSLYGPTHLLRLFVKFPLFLSRAKVPSSHVHTLHHHFKDLLSYLSSNLDIFSEDKHISQ